MKISHKISIILLVCLGLIALLGDLLDKNGTLGFVLSFVLIKFIGVLLLYIAYLLYKNNNTDEDNYDLDEWED